MAFLVPEKDKTLLDVFFTVGELALGIGFIGAGIIAIFTPPPALDELALGSLGIFLVKHALS